MTIKEKIATAAIFLLSVFFLLVVFNQLGVNLPVRVENLITQKNELFTISGEGKVVVVPDLAYVSLGIEKQGTTVGEAQQAINEINNRLVEKLRSLGVKEEDIETENYQIFPQYDWSSGKQKITGYQALTTLKVKIYSLERVNRVIDEATFVGVNHVYGVNFDVKDKEKYFDQARKKAVEEAKKKANQASKIAGFRLGKIVNYTEEIPTDETYPRFLGMGSIEKSKENTEVQPGSQEIKVRVSLSYQIE